MTKTPILEIRFSDTFQNGIITIDRFEGRPTVLMLAMSCAEVGNAAWLMIATRLGMPVSTTQTIVGALGQSGRGKLGHRTLHRCWICCLDLCQRQVHCT
jgi:hypothetical protein